MASAAAKNSSVVSPGDPSKTPPGVISLLEMYTIEEAKARLRWTDSALRAAKRKGLKLIACGKRRYVSGREIFRFLKSLEADSPN